jgi:hypothetical protein
MLLVKIDFYGVVVGAMTHNGSEIRPLDCLLYIAFPQSMSRSSFCLEIQAS